MSGQLLILDEVDSTQEEARRRFLDGARGPLWVLARRQTAGRGRRARQWHSPAGNLHLSLLVRPEAPMQRWPQMSLLASLVLVKALERLAVQAGRPGLRDALALKWPNDVLLHGRKLGGILLETAYATSGPLRLPDAVPDEHPAGRRALIIGWGVNLRQAPPPEQVRWPAIAWRETGLELKPALLFETLKGTFWRWYQVWQGHGVRNVLAAWRRRACGLGGIIRLQRGDEQLQGRFVDIEPDGALVLELPGGRREVLRAGEVTSIEAGE